VNATAAAIAMVLDSVPELVKRTSSIPEGEKRVVTYGRLDQFLSWDPRVSGEVLYLHTFLASSLS
jgi:hypothetical protein